MVNVMSEPIAQSLLRLPIRLKIKIEEAAKANNRSINSEVVARLQSSFESSAASLGVGELIDLLLKKFPAGMIEVKIGKVDEKEHEDEYEIEE